MTSMPERRRYPRFVTWLPLRLPRRIEPGQVIEVKVTLSGVGPGRKDVYISNEGYIVRTEPGNQPGWYKLAAAFDKPSSEDERGWHKLVAGFEHPPTSETES